MLSFLSKLPVLKRLIPSIIKKLKIKINYKRDNIIYYLDLRYLVDRLFYLYGLDNSIIKYFNKFIKKKNVIIFSILALAGAFIVYKSQNQTQILKLWRLMYLKITLND